METGYLWPRQCLSQSSYSDDIISVPSSLTDVSRNIRRCQYEFDPAIHLTSQYADMKMIQSRPKEWDPAYKKFI